MAASSSQDPEDMITGINITPMVDVMLVLLVIFMIAAPTLYNASIKIELPAAKSGEKTEKVTLKFLLSKDGKITLDKKEVTKAELPGLLKKSLEVDPKTDAVIEADRNLSHGSVVEFIDQLKGAGIHRFAIAVDSPEAPK